METFRVDRRETIVTPSGERYPLEDELGHGAWGTVYSVEDQPDKIVKLIQERDSKTKPNLLAEVAIQSTLADREPGVCPKIYAVGQVAMDGDWYYVVVMERCVGVATQVLWETRDESEVLDYYDQIAKILARLEKYKFNHRDLKSDNIMFKVDPVTKKKQFLLIDFGFACATFNKKRYAGHSYFTPDMQCFRRSRDLAALVFESMGVLEWSPRLQAFAQFVLTFSYQGISCNMAKGCPNFRPEWRNTYKFLNRSDVENPNTTPEGLQEVVAVFRDAWQTACAPGYMINPVTEQCAVDPGPPAPSALKPAISPHSHLASPVPPRQGSKTRRSPAPKECPPGKVLNPTTRRCKKAKVSKECPPGKRLNPATGRCRKV